MDEKKIVTAIEVFQDIVLDINVILAERQRAIDALTLFHDTALPALHHIAKKVDSGVLKERANLYIQRIKSGARVSMTI